MKRIITNGITNLEPLPGSSKWYWGSDYASNDLYEAEELFRSGHPIDKNRLVLVHCPEGTVYEPVCTKPGQYLGRPVYYDGRVVLLMVDFPKEEIRILTFHEAVETTKPLAVLPLSKRKIAAFEKNYMYDTPLLCIAFSMDIYDDEGDSVAIYTAIFDLDGNYIDDLMR